MVGEGGGGVGEQGGEGRNGGVLGHVGDERGEGREDLSGTGVNQILTPFPFPLVLGKGLKVPLAGGIFQSASPPKNTHTKKNQQQHAQHTV